MRQAPAIDGALAGGFVIDGEARSGPVLILDDAVQGWSGALDAGLLATLKAADKAAVELVIIGLGKTWTPAPRLFREALAAAGMGLEVMSTPEALRLYNMLAADGRRLAAAHLPL